MEVKILNIDLVYDSDTEAVNIITKYGKILEYKGFDDLKEHTYKLNKKIIELIQDEFAEETLKE